MTVFQRCPICDSQDISKEPDLDFYICYECGEFFDAENDLGFDDNIKQINEAIAKQSPAQPLKWEIDPMDCPPYGYSAWGYKTDEVDELLPDMCLDFEGFEARQNGS